MKMPFYKMDSERVHVSITAILENGKLSLDGFDYGKYYGKYVEEFRGTEDFDYTLSLDEENTGKLFALMGIADKTDEEKLEAVCVRFSPDKGAFGLYEYCKANNIAASYFSS